MSTTRTCINRYSLPTSVQWQFSGIPPPPQLLTPNLFHPSSGTGEFSGFGPCSGLGALPQDSKPNMPTTAIRLNVRVKQGIIRYGCFFFQSPQMFIMLDKRETRDIFHNITLFGAPSNTDMLSFHIVFNWSFHSTKCSLSDMALFQSNESPDFFCRNFPSFQ